LQARLGKCPAASVSYQPFPLAALPEPVRRFIATAAKAIGCDLCYIAVPLLAVLAAAIGNTRRILLKRGWAEPAVIWAVIVGESGTQKSPALDVVLRALRRLQNAAFKTYEEQFKEYEVARLRYEKDLATWRKSKLGGDPPEKPVQPTCVRHYVSDITVEALAERLQDNPRGLLLVREELSGWVKGFDKYRPKGVGGDVAHWLTMHGARDLVVDRKTGDRRTIHVPRAAVPVAGSIQPGILRRALTSDHFEEGLAARLFFAMPPPKAKTWSEDEIDPDVEQALEQLLSWLYQLRPDTDRDANPCPRDLRLDAEAKREWITFYNTHANEQAELTGDLAAAWSKLEGGAARLALLVHLTRWAGGEPMDPDFVDAASVRAGVVLARWFAHEALRVYAVLGESEEDRDRRRLVELIHRKGGRITARELMQGDRRFRDSADAAEQALQELVEAGLGTWEPLSPTDRGGHPSRCFHLSTSVYAYETPENPEESGGSVDVDSVDTPESADGTEEYGGVL
jgi:hypothetical protein